MIIGICLLALILALGRALVSRGEYHISTSTDAIANGYLKSFPKVPEPLKEPYAILSRVSSYTESEDETDFDPHITASGTSTRLGIAANNCLPFGTKVKIEDQEYQIEDRMNKRYGCDFFDVVMPDKETAFEWGIKEVEVVVLGSD